MDKLFRLTDQDVERLNKIKEEYNINTDVGAVRFALEQATMLVEDEKKEQRMVESIVNLLLIHSSEFNAMLKSSVRETEQKTTMLLDAINTILFLEHIDTCIPVDSIMSPTLQSSAEHLREKIAHKKQIKDDRRGKKR